MPTPARAIALGILGEVERGPTVLAEALAAPRAEALPSRERAFLHELVLGTLRQRGMLDHTLAALTDRSLGGLHPGVLNALRLGAHQILNLRVPDRAAVTESVDLARSEEPRAAGFVNAILRRLAREGARATPDPAGDPRGWLTTAGSLPAWLANRWIQVLGPERAVARARAMLETPKTTFRLNPRVGDAKTRLDAAEIRAEAAIVPGAWRAHEGRTVELQSEGVLYIQDEGSQLVAHLASGPGRRLDACAAPGGKALLMADLAGAEGTVVAAEPSLRRLASLKWLATRWGPANLRLLAADGLRPPFASSARLAGVLLDAPCSGLGTLGRHPDIRWKARAGDLPRHRDRQRALLESLAPLVEPGGRLVYSVCSAETEETEDVVKPFLYAHPEWSASPGPGWAAAFRDGNFLRTAPERHGGDAFFAAVLQRS